MHTITNPRIKRLLYQSGHRGTKELDILLGRYASARLVFMDDATLDIYAKLLDEDEADLFLWLTDQATPPAYAAVLVADIRKTLQESH